MKRPGLPLLLAVVFGGCIDFDAAQAAWCSQHPVECGAGADAGSDDAGFSVDGGLPDGGVPDAGTPDAGTPDGGLLDAGRLEPLRELNSSGGRLRGGTLTLDVQLGHPTPRTVMTGGTLTLTGAAAVQR